MRGAVVSEKHNRPRARESRWRNVAYQLHGNAIGVQRIPWIHPVMMLEGWRA